MEQGVDRILGLLKFGRCEHLEELRAGSLFLNRLGYFSELESTDPRYDQWEGVDVAFAPGTVELATEDRSVVISPDSFASHLRFKSEATSNLHVYCMYAVLESKAEDLFAAQDLGFGDHWVLFRDGDKFLRRVRTAAEANGLSCRSGLVEYVDSVEHSGQVGPFRKRAVFAPQSEARIVIGPGEAKPGRLEVGDLSDVVTAPKPVSDLASEIRIHRGNDA